MSVSDVLMLIGAPSIFLALLSFLWRQVRVIQSVRAGVQALLRAQMIADWNKYSQLGYAPIYARENFENCWVKYHSLGVNGVMDDLHIKFLHLPTEPEEEVHSI